MRNRHIKILMMWFFHIVNVKKAGFESFCVRAITSSFTFKILKIIFPFLEIVDGNLKATMRLVLALAAHFKPGSVKPNSHQGGSPSHTKLTRSPSAAAAAAEAAAAIGEASRKAASAGRQIHMPFRLR